MSKKYKILVPKIGAGNKEGTTTRIYKTDEIVDANDQWQEDIMQIFIRNEWAIEVKKDSPEETVKVEAKIKRARNKKGQLIGDDPSTPDVNEAWEGGKAPKKTTKKTTKKK